MIKEECDIILNYIDWENGYRTNYQAKRKWVSCESEIEFLKQYSDVFNELFLMYDNPILKKLEKIKQLDEKKNEMFNM